MNYLASMFSLALDAQLEGLDCVLYTHSESLITRARNRMLATFLERKDCTHLFWIDADVSFRPRNVFKLLAYNLDVVAAVPPLKAPGDTQYPVKLVGPRVGDLVEAIEAPTGFMAIKRDVFDKMAEAYPGLGSWVEEPDGSKRGIWRFFDTMVEPDPKSPHFSRYLSEDYAFCRRWRDAGGKIYVDVECRLGHLGQRMYEGELGDSLRGD